MTTSIRRERLEARITPELKALLVRAAELQGTSLSDFITLHLWEVANATIREHEILELDAQERELFLSALLDPPAPNEQLRKADERYRAIMDT